jgi:cysteinyl-tRNA synthetase
VLFDAVREGNRLSDEDGDATGVAAAVERILEVLGLILELASSDGLESLAPDLEELAAELGLAPGHGAEETLKRVIDRRTEARASKDWSTSDKIRDGLATIGIVIEDGADGVAWHRK